MELLKILDTAINILRTNDNYDDFESQISLGRVVDFIKFRTTELSNLSGQEYKKLFIILTSLIVSRFSNDKDYNTTLAGVAFYCGYRCIDKGIETGEKLYDDNYSNNNLLFIFGHDNLVRILENANNYLENANNHLDPLFNLDIHDFEQEIYQMEYAQYLNNLRITHSEQLYINRLDKICKYIPYGIQDRVLLNKKLRNNQKIIFDYVSKNIEEGSYKF